MNAPKSKPKREALRAPVAPALRAREERLDALNRLASKLGHDFNNHLAPILGYVTMIKEDAAGNAPVLHYASVMDHAARQTTELLDTMLSAVRPQRRFHLESTDLTALVREEAARWQAGLPANAQISVKLDLAPCTLTVDRAQWQQVVQQLLKNAHYALGTGGTLEISLQAAPVDEQAASDLGLSTTDTYCLTVADNGFGMSDETMQQAFHPFFTTRPKGTAQGLGLTLVHNVVRLHGGQIVLKSREDEGTTVTIWLPTTPVAAVDEIRPALTPQALVATGRLTGRKVLVVDDDAMVREVVKTALQRAGLVVVTAANGQEGLEVFHKHSKDLALIISDVSMPVLGGFEMVRQIRNGGVPVPVIFISGEIATVPAEFESPAVATVLVRKPFALKGFVETIKSHLG